MLYLDDFFIIFWDHNISKRQILLSWINISITNQAYFSPEWILTPQKKTSSHIFKKLLWWVSKVPSREFFVKNSPTLVVWTFQFYPNSSKLLWESRTVRTVKGTGGWSPSPDFTRYVPMLTILQSEGRGAHDAHNITPSPPRSRIFLSSYGPRKRKRGVKGQYFLDISPLERPSYMPSDFLKASDLGKKCLGCFDEFCLGKKLVSEFEKSWQAAIGTTILA